MIMFVKMWQYMNKELFKAIEIEPDHEVSGRIVSFIGQSKLPKRRFLI